LGRLGVVRIGSKRRPSPTFAAASIWAALRRLDRRFCLRRSPTRPAAERQARRSS